MRLFQRNGSIPNIHKIEKDLAQQKLEEMTNKIGCMTSQPIKYKIPVQHVIIDTYLKRAECDLAIDGDTCRVLLDCIKDFDSVDHEGNTLIIYVASHIQSHDSPASRVVNLMNLLIYQGAYTYARNKKGKAVIDYVAHFVNRNQEENRKQSPF